MLGIFGGLIIIILMILVGVAESLAITFWFISVPLLIVLIFVAARRGQNVQDNMTPQERARSDRDLALLRADNAMYKRIKDREKELRRRH